MPCLEFHVLMRFHDGRVGRADAAVDVMPLVATDANPSNTDLGWEMG